MEPVLMESHLEIASDGTGPNWHYWVAPDSDGGSSYTLHVFSYPGEGVYRCRVFHYPHRERLPDIDEDIQASMDAPQDELWTFASGSFPTADAALAHATAVAERHMAGEDPAERQVL